MIVLQRMLKLWPLLTCSSLTPRIMKPVYNSLVACCFLFAACFFSSLSLQAQVDTSSKKKRNPVFYFSPNLSITNKRIMPGLGFTIVNRSGWAVSLQGKMAVLKAEQMPEDFVPGGIIIFGDGKPIDTYSFYTLSLVRDISTKDKKIIPGIMVGLSFAEKNIAANFTKLPPSNGWFDWGSNYDYEYRKTKTAGLFLKPKLKYVFSRVVAIETGAWTILTPKGSYYGAELSLLIGKLK